MQLLLVEKSKRVRSHLLAITGTLFANATELGEPPAGKTPFGIALMGVSIVRVLVVFGTRPEAIKLAPVVWALSRTRQIDVTVCCTGQHREMVRPLIDLFGLKLDYDLQVMCPNQSLPALTGRLLSGISDVITETKPDLVVVQGDTTTAFSGALAAQYNRVPVAHVEAGLRTGDLASPWPEEANRRLIAPLASHHFAPTRGAAQNLRREGVPKADIAVTGNTVIDALQWIAERLDSDAAFRAAARRPFKFIDDAPERKLVLVTGHRRENMDGGLEHMCRAVADIARRPDVVVAFPVHMNPAVRRTVDETLRRRENVLLLEPLDYHSFVALMREARLIITDSGGIQEEAPTFGTPVLVTRDTSERTEAIDAGMAQLVGTERERIVAEAAAVLDAASMPQASRRGPLRVNPYGDGLASERISARIAGEAFGEFKAPSLVRGARRVVGADAWRLLHNHAAPAEMGDEPALDGAR